VDLAGLGKREYRDGPGKGGSEGGSGGEKGGGREGGVLLRREAIQQWTWLASAKNVGMVQVEREGGPKEVRFLRHSHPLPPFLPPSLPPRWCFYEGALSLKPISEANSHPPSLPSSLPPSLPSRHDGAATAASTKEPSPSSPSHGPSAW